MRDRQCSYTGPLPIMPYQYSTKQGYAVTIILLQRTSFKLTSRTLLLTHHPHPWTYWWKYKMSGITHVFWSGVIADIYENSCKNFIWPKVESELQQIFNKARVRPKWQVRFFFLSYLTNTVSLCKYNLFPLIDETNCHAGSMAEVHFKVANTVV